MRNAPILRILPVATAVLAAAAGAVLFRTPVEAKDPDAPAPLEYRVTRTSDDIHLDGNPSDPAWETAPAAGPFRLNADAVAAPLATEVRMLYDDDSLYVLFRCEDPEPWATKENWDDNLWEEEAVEVFLQPDAKKPAYAEFEVNPLGTVMDTWCPEANKAVPFDTWNLEGLRAAVRGVEKNPKGWTCEIGIPWKGLNANRTSDGAAPKPGDRWRIGLYRVEAKPKPMLLAWSPTMGPSFHVPEKFGVLVFGEKASK